MRKHVPPPEVSLNGKAKIGIIYYGTSRWAAEECLDQLAREYDLEASSFRLLAYPFTEALSSFIERHERVYVIDQNRDGQLLALMRLELPVELIAKLRGIRYYGGMPLDARTLTNELVSQEGL